VLKCKVDMSKVIKLYRKSIKHNRTFKILSSINGNNNCNSIKLGLLEFRKLGERNLFLNINKFKVDFLTGAKVTRKVLNLVKYSGVLLNPWNFINLNEKNLEGNSINVINLKVKPNLLLVKGMESKNYQLRLWKHWKNLKKNRMYKVANWSFNYKKQNLINS